MQIKQSVINTFNRVGIGYQSYDNTTKSIEVFNRFSGESCMTTPLVAHLIGWVYDMSNQYEMGRMPCSIADFDRVRYFVMDTDSTAYMTCLD